MKLSLVGAAIGAIAIALYVWKDGVNGCQDGARYTSGVRQPAPFHQRFCAWPPRLLAVLTWASFVALSSTFDSWSKSALFVTMPGVWFCAIMPTTVDGPAMLLAWVSSLLFPTHPFVAMGLSGLAGGIHERAPVFAAMYAWTPFLLLGMAVPLIVGLRQPAKANHGSADLADRLVGHASMWHAAIAHRSHVDMLSESGLVWALRGVVPLAAWVGTDVRAWVALGVAYLSRLVATDTARAMLWASPPLIAGMSCVPSWAVAIHVLTFRRVTR